MSDSLILLHRLGRYSLALRHHELGGTEYSPLCRLTAEQAHAMEGVHTGLFFVHKERPLDVPIEKRAISIARRQDRPPHARSWELMLGNERVAYIDDEAVRQLQARSRVSFGPGEPNWKTREIEEIDDQILDRQDEITRLRARRIVLQDHGHDRDIEHELSPDL